MESRKWQFSSKLFTSALCFWKAMAFVNGFCLLLVNVTWIMASSKRPDVTLIYYKVCITLVSGVNIYYIHSLPHLAPKNWDLQGVLIMLDHIFINVSIFSRNLWSCISPLATFFNDLKHVWIPVGGNLVHNLSKQTRRNCNWAPLFENKVQAEVYPPRFCLR